MPSKKVAPKKAAFLTAPRKLTYWIAAALAILGLILYIVSFFVKTVALLIPGGVILLALGFLLLALGNVLKGL